MRPQHRSPAAAGAGEAAGAGGADAGPQLSLVIPCYNEEAVIEASYRRVKAICESLASEYEIILGNDGSSDNTLRLIEEIAADDGHVMVTSHYPNRGAGYTYREMYKAARGEIIIQMDADLAMTPEVAVPALLAALEKADVAVGSRYVGVEADYPLKRRLFSHGYILLNRLLFHLDVKDTQTGCLAFYREALASLDLHADGFEMLLEFIAQAEAGGLKVAEVGLPWVHDTASGETNVWKESIRMLAGTMRVRRQLGAAGRHRGDGGPSRKESTSTRGS